MAAMKHLQQEYELLSEKIHRLRMDWHIETDTAVKFKLEKQIEAAEAEQQRVLQQLEGAEQLTLTCPYRGLFAFREQDERFFFGRDAYIVKLLEAVQAKPFTAVIGASGSGKSSIVYAGVCPQLRRQGHWRIAACRPGYRMFQDLPITFQGIAAALLPFLEPDADEIDRLAKTKKLCQTLTANDLSLANVLSAIMEKDPERPLLLVIDQFEELYTLWPEDADRRRFLDALLGVQNLFCKILITLRADFLGNALAYRPFADALQDATQVLGPMTRAELEETITAPLKTLHAAGVPNFNLASIEDGLTDRILDAVAETPGHLPLLEFALTELWNKQAGGVLTHAAYDAIGGVEQALTRYADRVYADLRPDEQQQLQRIFTQLVRPGEGTSDTRRVATCAELGDANRALVTKLADVRLVVTGGGSGIAGILPAVEAATSQSPEKTGRQDAGDPRETVEVVHEVLITGWQRLRDWMDADREFRLWQERLRAAMRQWRQSQQDEGGLLRGGLLAEAERWQQERAEELSAEEQQFIAASSVLRQREHAARERVRRRNIAALSAGLMIAVTLSIAAGLFWYNADTARREADRRSMISLAQSCVYMANQLTQTGERERAALLTRQAYLLNQQHGGQISDQIQATLRLIFLSKDETTDILLPQVCDRVTRNLTPEEWRTAAGRDDIPYAPCPGLAENPQAGARFVLRLRSAPMTTNEYRDLSFNLKPDGYPWTDIANAFEDQGEVIVDHATGLMWQKAGSEKGLEHDAAQAYCQNLTLAGTDDWRLPTIEELLSLLELERQSNDLYISPMFEMREYSWYWSSDIRQTKGEGSSGAAWFVDFNYGSVYWNYVSDKDSIRCVRS